MYFVYILKSLRDDRTYVGYTNNLDERLKRHNAGLVFATKHRSPLKLIYSEQFDTIKEAMNREKYFKSGGGRRKMKQMFLNDLQFAKSE